MLSHPTELLAKARREADLRHRRCLEFISVSLGCRPALRVPQLHADPIVRSPNHRPRPRLPFHSDPLRNSLPKARCLQTDAQLARAKCPCGLVSAVTFSVRSLSFPGAGPQHRRPLR